MSNSEVPRYDGATGAFIDDFVPLFSGGGLVLVISSFRTRAKSPYRDRLGNRGIHSHSEEIGDLTGPSSPNRHEVSYWLTNGVHGEFEIAFKN